MTWFGPRRDLASLLDRARFSRRPRQVLEELEQWIADRRFESAERSMQDELFDVFVELADRSDEREIYRRALVARAHRVEETHGATSIESLRAWFSAGDVADEDCDWEMASDAWHRVLRAPSGDEATDEQRRLVADAARHRGARLLREEPGAALELFERDLAIREALGDPGFPDRAISLGNIATAFEALGDRTAGRDARVRQLALSEAALGANHVNVAVLRRQLSERYGSDGSSD